MSTDPSVSAIGSVRRRGRHSALLASVSALALLVTEPVVARPLGGPAPTPSAAAVAAAQAASQEAQRAAQNAQNALKRATLAIQAQQATQQAARDAARAALSTVPNGLKPGGLVPVASPNSTNDGLTAWIGANAPKEKDTGGKIDVTIEQTQSNAILSWQSFNVGRDTTLTFDQKGNANWIALNRVVDPNAAPSRILGSIKADGTVLVINRNGIVFGAGSQINVHSLIASTLDVGPMSAPQGSNGQFLPTDIVWRNQNFLQNGLLGFSPSGSTDTARFSPLSTAPANTGSVTVDAGASITTSGEGGLVLLTAPHVINAGSISSPAGQVILAATDKGLYLTPSSGAADDNAAPGAGSFAAGPDSDIRGVVPAVEPGGNAIGYYVWNQASGLIEADRGNITLISPGRNSNFRVGGASYNDGVLAATTSVSRNGSIVIDGADIRLGAGSLLTILPDMGGETIPQDPTSLGAFKPSAIKIGARTSSIANTALIEMEANAFLYAPGAKVQFGASVPTGSTVIPLNQSIVINAGAEINVAGLTDVLVPATENMVVIDPAKKNELRDSPLYRDGFLNGATIYLDPRISGVRADGVAWIGSPLIDATAYYQLMGVSAERLMTKGGNVSFGPKGAIQDYNSPAVIIRDGAVIDMSGGWVTYEAGRIRETRLVTASGGIVPISKASPYEVYVGIYNGWTRSSARWGISETWTNPLKQGWRYEAEYTEGRDAGALLVSGHAVVLDGIVRGDAYAGRKQRQDSKTGSGTSTIDGDLRSVQGAFSELPAGGALIVNGIDSIEITNALPGDPEDAYNWVRGAVDAGTGNYLPPNPTAGPSVPAVRRDTIYLSSDVLSAAGLSQVSLTSASVTSPGKITVADGADVVLKPGGIFKASVGGKIEVDGNITAQSGRIILETSVIAGKGTLGDYDIVINGDLSVAGRWVNEYGASGDYVEGHAWLDGGSISLTAGAMPAPAYSNVGSVSWDPVTGLPRTSGQPNTNPIKDISGSILVSGGLNLSGGGYIDREGAVDFGAKGGSLSLASNVRFYQESDDSPSGFRIVTDVSNNFRVSNNPDGINARIVFDPASLQAHGFGGGGTFTLVTPEFKLGDGAAAVGTVLPFDFFSKAGFSTYDITSNKTEFSANTFTNGYGGYNALLATQTVTVGAGQTLVLAQSVLPNILSGAQYAALRGLASGGDVNTVVSAAVPANAWDQKAVNLKLGGAMELHVEQGGSIVGAAGSTLTVGGLLNEGTIRIAGGRITQEVVLPRIYSSIGGNNQPLGIRALSDIFSVNADGTINPAAFSTYDPTIRNQNLVGDFNTSDPNSGLQGRVVYKLGVLDQNEGIVLANGSVTDLSGAVILNPYAVIGGRRITTGQIVGGGTVQALPSQQVGTEITSPYRPGRTIVAETGALLDISGVSGAFDMPGRNGLQKSTITTPVWSAGGSLIASAGGTFTGATIHAQGGDAQAAGGTLKLLNPVFTQHDPSVPTANMISADMIAASGFDTFAALGNITSKGDVTLKLDRGFFSLAKPYDGFAALAAPVISTGGSFVIEAPYIAFQNAIDAAAPATTGTPGGGTVTFRGRQIDIIGTALFDRSVAHVLFEAAGDIRLTGVAPWNPQGQSSAATLKGGIAVNGDLTMTAAQIYPTTGSSFAITSTAANGTIRFGRSSGTAPATPYSAAGNLTVQAAHIVQGGVLRIPFGTLTLGGNSAYTRTLNNVVTTFAPATQSVVLADGSITSVSANGLVIPYGTTTDTKEWYFAPTNTDQLSGPPVKVLSLNGSSITLGTGATVDLSGGGDVYAYEFVPGTGGSRDVLDRFNADQYSSNGGFQYPDARQVYAIVPGLSDAPAAAYDPIYSADYADLQSASGVGKRVWLDAAPGLKAGWYTLLPAKYAMLPGGMRVVEQSASTLPGVSSRSADGTLFVSGRYGDALSGAAQSQARLFSVQSQDVIRSYSNIVLTSGNRLALTKAANNGEVTPRTGLDAGRLVLNPLVAMTVNAAVRTAAAPGGRGAQVDITGIKISILSSLDGAPDDGAIHLTAGDLNRLNAESLLIGGFRTDNADGTTSLTVTANSILVANNATNPLVGPELVLAVDDGPSGTVASKLTLADGATIIATGTLSDERDGAYVIDGRLGTSVTNGTTTYTAPAQSAIGALLRVANGPERLVERLRTPVSPTNPGSPAGLAASLTLGRVDLRGDAIGLDTSHDVSVYSAARLLGRSISLGASAMAFTQGSIASGTVVITPELQAVLSQGQHLTLRSQTSIGFDDGTYRFGDTTLDAAALTSREGGQVTFDVTRLELANAGAASTAQSGSGTLVVHTDELSIGSGSIATDGFGAVNLTAAKGIFAAGQDGVLDVGGSLFVATSFIGDRGTQGVAPKGAISMTLKATGTVSIANAGTAAVDLAGLAGIPGSSITIEGNGITISGTHLRATAGSLSVKSAGNLTLANGAILETPGYQKTFGDAVDPQAAAAPGGSLSLTAAGTSGIALGDAVLSVGGGKGNGGSLKLSAANGAVDWGTAVLDGRGGAGSQGGRFTLDTNGAIDLVAMNDWVVANGFTSGFNLRTRNGDIVLAAGQVLRSGSVNLTADGGFVVVGGTIDTSGTYGGDIDLYGKSGVTLQATARLDSHAEGYPSDDSRKAKAGDITLGTDFTSSTVNADGSVSGTSGTISVASGAVIDASARRPGNRLVRLMRNGVVNYQYVEGDEGGIVVFRAPVVNGNSVNVHVASADSVRGAKAIDLEGFKRWDLAAVADSGLYSGVVRDAATNTITLDLRTGLDTANTDGSLATVAGLNFLGDKGAGTVVEFVQNFDVSGSYEQLGGLAGWANFHARPGVDLTHTGNITLASNWNLGAGTVNVDRAVANNRMAIDATTGKAYVIVGQEAAVLANDTVMTYRVGGRPTGAAPVISLRAGGDLHLQGSLTDGFFQFRDQYDATYQSYLNGSGNLSLLNLAVFFGPYVNWQTYVNTPDAFLAYLGSFLMSDPFVPIDALASSGGGGSGGGMQTNVPFNALANSPAALGTGPGGSGDPLASAVVFPLLSGGQVVASSDYRLAAGAATTSADPLRIAATAAGRLTIDGPKPSTMVVPAASLGNGLTINLVDGDQLIGGGTILSYDITFQAGQAGFEDFMRGLLPGLSGDSVISLGYATGIPANLQTFINNTLAADPGAAVKIWFAGFNSEVSISLSLFGRFLEQYSGLGGGGGGTGQNVSIRLLPQTMVRTGVGNIRMAAAGNVDLTGGATRYVNKDGSVAAAPSNSAAQLGGAVIYTAGHRAASTSEILSDPVTGRPVTVSFSVPTTSIFSAPPLYKYGVPTAPVGGVLVTGATSVVLADPLYLTGGGDIDIASGGDVLSRRDLSLANILTQSNLTVPWLGTTAAFNQASLSPLTAAQYWRVNGVTPSATTAAISPLGFRDGLGALGGGSIRVQAGGVISDIQAVADTSLITATATSAGGPATKALVTLGGGNVALRAGSDILAARIDVASGAADIDAGGRIGGLNVQLATIPVQYRDTGNVLRTVNVPFLADSPTYFRINDATIDATAGGAIGVEGIRMLDGFYSEHSALNLTANGSITIANTAPMSPSIGAGSVRLGSYAVYPGTLNVASLMGDANLRTYAAPPTGGLAVVNPPAAYNMDAPSAILMVPSPTGQLRILAGGDIKPTKIAMLDGDPNLLPGLFTLGGKILLVDDPTSAAGAGKPYQFAFPAVFSNTREGSLEALHMPGGTHANDPTPVYVYADGDIGTATSGATLFLPKQARVYAGRDIVNMMFFGQNLAASDVTRIVAGQDIVGTSRLLQSTIYSSTTQAPGTIQPTLQGNSFILGGPGELMVEAGRDMGPFLNSAAIKNWNLLDDGLNLAGGAALRFGGGILTVGNDWNPYLPERGANITVMFGAGKGADYTAFRDAYVKPGSAANALGGYDLQLSAWMRENARDALIAAYGTAETSAEQAYAVFLTLPDLRQRSFLNQVYFSELRAPAVVGGPSYLKYSRGYAAVNTLFPASLGYTANGLEGGASDNAVIHTGDLDLRLAAIETLNGGDINILGPGGRVLAGSVVATAQQAARRNYSAYGLYRPQQPIGGVIAPIEFIPPGYEGVITQRGGTINTFTDGDFLLNQSRLFTVKGGDITMWSSNADLNAGQGAKTTPNFPPVAVKIGKNMFAEVDQAGATSGAGIAALPPGAEEKAPDVYLLAPRGTVDAGDAGVRSAGDLSVAALRVVNADNFKVGGATTGIPTVQAPNIGGLTEASNTAGAASQQASTPKQGSGNAQPSIIIVEVVGFGGGDDGEEKPGNESRSGPGRQSNRSDGYDPSGMVRVLGNGAFTTDNTQQLTQRERDTLSTQVAAPSGP
ncbi:filamentous hemagglutinin family protein [Microbacteriaceae bacterium K1510]|nr:filamentous hemagglutinin family protein [Microbacteriaceae bacterium K1510]